MLKFCMIRNSHTEGCRAVVLAMALVAITINFLQPLAHAALMRGGAPADWAAICMPNAGDDGQQAPTEGRVHECCLGLAHAPFFTGPSASFDIIELPAAIDRQLVAAEVLTTVGIRDGPSQPRAPPSHT